MVSRYAMLRALAVLAAMVLAAMAGGCTASADPDEETEDTGETACSDGIDNDADGALDCDDPDCAADPACELVYPACRDAADCQVGEICDNGLCRNYDGALFCDGPEHALVLVDPRLYAEIYDDLNAYAAAACERRGFGIRVVGVEGIDDMHFSEVRDLLIGYRASYAELEGVLFVGNTPLPSFFLSRPDIPGVKYWPRYYQDLDMVMDKTIPDGTVLGECAGGTDPDGYPDNWPCIVSDLYSTPYTVPEHDFDDFDQGPHYGLELWAAFLPVGYGEPEQDTYAGWAAQLRPFFAKALSYYADPDGFAPNLYHVGNDLNNVSQFGLIWDLIGPEAIDYYAINTLGEGLCDDNPACYVRAPLEDYPSLEAFLAYAETLPWMGEGWQDPAIFLSHMNSDDHFPRKVVYWNVHSTPTLSLVTWQEANYGISPGKGGLIALLDGCLVGTYQRPGAPLPEHLYRVPYVKWNVMANLVYGQGAFIAAVGSIPPRVFFDHYGVLLDRIYTDGYLGAADRERSDVQDQADDKRFAYRLHQEILIGDPFVDAR